MGGIETRCDIVYQSKIQSSARRVVIATGYESQLALKKKFVDLKSAYALATVPIAGPNPVYRQLCIWETARPYFYFRTTADLRILLGGADVDFRDADRRDRLIPENTCCLQRRFGELLPRIQTETEYAWAGTFGETKDSLRR